MSSTHSFDGKRVAISGRFSNTIAGFTNELEALGARVTKSISTSTDYLILGKRPSDTASQRAQCFGVVVLLEAEARAAMVGEAIEVNRPGEGGTRSMDELLGEARSLTAQPPKPEIWHALLRLCEECDLTQLNELTHYIQDHTSQWGTAQMRGQCGTEKRIEPDMSSRMIRPSDLFFEELRTAPTTWAGELLKGIKSPKFELVHALSLVGSSSAISKALNNPHLTSVSRLHIHARPAPTDRLNRTLCDTTLLEHLAYFSPGNTSLETVNQLASHTRPMALETLDMSRLRVLRARHTHEIHARVLDVPFFSTVRTLIVSGPSHAIHRMAQLRSKHGGMPNLTALRLRSQHEFKGTHLRHLVMHGMLHNVTLLDLGNVPLMRRGALEHPWRDACRNELPRCVTSLDLSRMAESLTSTRKDTSDADIRKMLMEIFEGRILTHVTHVLLGDSIHDPRFTEAFTDARPDITLTGSRLV